MECEIANCMNFGDSGTNCTECEENFVLQWPVCKTECDAEHFLDENKVCQACTHQFCGNDTLIIQEIEENLIINESQKYEKL